MPSEITPMPTVPYFLLDMQDLIFDDEFTLTKQFESAFIHDLFRVRGKNTVLMCVFSLQGTFDRNKSLMYTCVLCRPCNICTNRVKWYMAH